jgi:ABC-type uncharacterized transport system fused permease/ATPase subunit
VWCCCCSVWFNFVGRNFFNALAEKDVDLFKLMIIKYLFSFVAGIPVFVLADYYQVTHPRHTTHPLSQLLMPALQHTAQGQPLRGKAGKGGVCGRV